MFDIFSFWGRIDRARYWGFSGLCLLVFVLSSIAIALTANSTNATPVNVVAVGVAIAGLVLCCAMVVALLGLGVRRLHDRGKSGFWIALYYPAYPAVPLSLFDPDPVGLVRIALFCVVLPIMVWSMIDLGFLKGKPADDLEGPVAEAA
jgi:uncharacterized membrane protein YhaH (DUF805 family)